MDGTEFQFSCLGNDGNLSAAKQNITCSDCLTIGPNWCGSCFRFVYRFHATFGVLFSDGLKVLILDNYDSFTYNLVHYCEQFASCVEVIRNDEIEMAQIKEFDKLILSPGPGLPQQAGRLMEVFDHLDGGIPVLGVCLGMQAIAEHFGFPLRNLETVRHGKTSTIEVLDPSECLFANLPQSMEVGHYHSWVVDEGKIGSPLKVTSKNENGLVMSIRHESLDISGAQFHPESVLTPHGLRMMENWIKGDAKGTKKAFVTG